MSCQTLNDDLSFATSPSQLRAFNHIMFNMIIKSIIYGVIDLRISCYDSNINVIQHHISFRLIECQTKSK
jgi:hypothetical protein